jgi:hypothetical protein
MGLLLVMYSSTLLSLKVANRVAILGWQVIRHSHPLLPCFSIFRFKCVHGYQFHHSFISHFKTTIQLRKHVLQHPNLVIPIKLMRLRNGQIISTRQCHLSREINSFSNLLKSVSPVNCAILTA